MQGLPEGARGQEGHSSLCVALTRAGPSCFLAGALSLLHLDFEYCNTPPPKATAPPFPPLPPSGPELLWRAVLG